MKINRNRSKNNVTFNQLILGQIYETQDPDKDAGETMFVMFVGNAHSGKTMLVNLETGRIVENPDDAVFTECKDACLYPHGHTDIDNIP